MESRYDRQLILPEIGPEGQARLKAARVLLVGCGGLGAPISTYLVGAGIGTLGIMDDDVVSVTNLQRQVLFDTTQVGKPKVECAKERLGKLNPEVRIIVYHARADEDNLPDIAKDYDIIVDGTDNFKARFVISDVCEAMGKPFVHGTIGGLQGQVAVLCKGHATFRTLFPDEEEILAMPHPGKQVVGVTPAMVGSVEAAQVIQLICGYGEPLIDRLWTIDLTNMQSYIIDL